MVNRRTTLLALGAGMACAAAGRVSSAERSPAPPMPAKGSEQDMQEDLAKLGSHEYSDEGIPVFLACVNLVAEPAGKTAPPSNAFSKQIATDLRRYSAAWQKTHPDAPDTDANKIIEVLAARDFANGGTGASR